MNGFKREILSFNRKNFKWINKVRKVGATMIMDKLNMMINYSDESSTKYIISNFIKNNIIKIPNMTITQLASACYTSKRSNFKIYPIVRI